MGQMIDEEECEVCIPFDQEWIFTYGDLVTLLFCFFVLLFSMCVYETEKFKSVASSFKPLPAGTPFISEGRDSLVEDISKKVEESELGDDADVNVEDKGVVVSFRASTFFEANSTDLNAKGVEELTRFSKLIFLLPNRIQIEGHTNDSEPKNWSSNWELSGARAAKVARIFVDNGMDPKRVANTRDISAPPSRPDTRIRTPLAPFAKGRRRQPPR